MYEYYVKTFEVLDIETDKEIPFKDSFFRIFGLLQVIYVQQDLTDAIAKVFGVNIENAPNRKINRDLREELVGHPLSDRRGISKQKSKNLERTKSTIILKNVTSKKFHYTSFEPENEKEKYIDKVENIDSILRRHIAFIIDNFDLILKKCFNELERQVIKYEEYVIFFYDDNNDETEKYKTWFDKFINTNDFELKYLIHCTNKHVENKKYEAYLVEFKRMIVVSYLEMVDRFKSFYEKLQRISSTDYNFELNYSRIEKLTIERKEIESYFPKSDNHTIVHDLRDISKPFDDSWDIGFNQLSRVFSNKVDVINELNYLKMIKSEAIEYEISYRYIRFLVGYS